MNYLSKSEGSVSGEPGEVEITNIYETIEIKVTKVWKSDINNKLPDAITINLLANGKKIKTEIVTEDDDWKCSFKNMPKYNNDREIEYTVEEEKIDGYETSISGNSKDGFVITNKEIVTKKVIINTGDDSGMLMYLFMFSIAALTLVFLSLKKRRIEN